MLLWWAVRGFEWIAAANGLGGSRFLRLVELDKPGNEILTLLLLLISTRKERKMAARRGSGDVCNIVS